MNTPQKPMDAIDAMAVEVLKNGLWESDPHAYESKCVKILWVDWESVMFPIIKALLKKVPTEVTCVTTAQEAMDAMADDEFDLIGLSGRLSRGTLIDLAEWIRREAPGVPMMLSPLHPVSVAELERSGVCDYFIQPFCTKGLMHAVKTALLQGSLWRSDYLQATLNGTARAYLQQALDDCDGDMSAAMERTGRRREFLLELLGVEGVFDSRSFHFSNAVLPVMFLRQGTQLLDAIEQRGPRPVLDAWRWVGHFLDKVDTTVPPELTVEFRRLAPDMRAAFVSLPDMGGICESHTAAMVASEKPGQESIKRFFLLLRERHAGPGEAVATLCEVALGDRYEVRRLHGYAQIDIDGFAQAVAQYVRLTPAPQRAPSNAPPNLPRILGALCNAATQVPSTATN